MNSRDTRKLRRMHAQVAAVAVSSAVAALSGCGGSDGGASPSPAPSPAPQAALQCDDSMKTGFAPDANTKVTMVKAFKKGDMLPPAAGGFPGAPAPAPSPSPVDVCFVKLLVGPGNPGPAGAPSTSPGIGIEVWLPSAANWNERIRNQGGGGWAGGVAYTSTTDIASVGNVSYAAQGYVVGSTDTGHSVGSGAFAMNPDGSINTALWTDFAERSLHELAVKTKALAQGFYQKQQKFAYWEGCSTGGRQGYKIAQTHPTDYDGYMIGAPAINWTKFLTAELYPAIVYQRDLGGTPLSTDQANLVNGKAVSACDVVGGQHLGYITDHASCRYDPTKDASVLCAGTVGNGVTGTNNTAACLTPSQAQAANKIWHGQTPDGSVTDPSANNGFAAQLAGNQLWFGLPRGTNFGGVAGANGFSISTDVVAQELQDATLADPLSPFGGFANGTAGWKNLTYGQLANAYYQGVALQPLFGGINADNPDLSGVKKAGGKIISYHGLNDVLIIPQGSMNYYTNVANLDGGFAKTQEYNRLFMVPAMSHCGGIGTVSGDSGVSPAATVNNVPLPGGSDPNGPNGYFFDLLQKWVEQGAAPDQAEAASGDNSVTARLCPYPKKAVYSGSGSVKAAASYTCQ